MGGLPATPTTKRDTTSTLDPTYTLATSISLPADTTIYSDSKYLTVSAEKAVMSGTATFSGLLTYNWLTFSITQLTFDVDTAYSMDMEMAANVDSSYSKTFSYSPATLSYSAISVPGILEIGPELVFNISALVSASEAVKLTVEGTMAVTNGAVHLDLLDESLTSATGWTPKYSVSATASGTAVATINPAIGLTVELAINFFDGLLDLSTGLTATPGLSNVFTLSADASAGASTDSSALTCSEGLIIKSDFTFAVVGFATEWLSKTLYSVDVPIVDKCYTF